MRRESDRLALEYANDNYEADVLPGDSAARQRREHKATEARSDNPTSTNARRSSPSRMTLSAPPTKERE